MDKVAYFVVLSNAETGEFIECDIWSSPPWAQTMLPKGTVAGVYATATANTFQEAMDHLKNTLANRVIAINANATHVERLTRNWRGGDTSFQELVQQKKKIRRELPKIIDSYSHA